MKSQRCDHGNQDVGTNSIQWLNKRRIFGSGLDKSGGRLYSMIDQSETTGPMKWSSLMTSMTESSPKDSVESGRPRTGTSKSFESAPNRLASVRSPPSRGSVPPASSLVCSWVSLALQAPSAVRLDDGSASRLGSSLCVRRFRLAGFETSTHFSLLRRRFDVDAADPAAGSIVDGAAVWPSVKRYLMPYPGHSRPFFSHFLHVGSVRSQTILRFVQLKQALVTSVSGKGLRPESAPGSSLENGI